MQEFAILPGKMFSYKRIDPKGVYEYHSNRDFACVMKLADYLQMPKLGNYILALVAAIKQNCGPCDIRWSWFYTRFFVHRLGQDDMLSEWVCDWVVFSNTPVDDDDDGDEWMDIVSVHVLEAAIKAYARCEAFQGHSKTCPQDESCPVEECMEEWANTP